MNKYSKFVVSNQHSNHFQPIRSQLEKLFIKRPKMRQGIIKKKTNFESRARAICRRSVCDACAALSKLPKRSSRSMLDPL